LFYALRLFDDVDTLSYWSAIETDAEMACLRRLLAGETCSFPVYNEGDVNVALNRVRFDRAPEEVYERLIGTSRPAGESTSDRFREFASSMVNAIGEGRADANHFIRLGGAVLEPWDLTVRHFSYGVTGNYELSPGSEAHGPHQELLFVWLLGHEFGCRVYHSPEVESRTGRRELCDGLLVGDGWCLIAQSKTPTVDSLKTRVKLANKVISLTGDAIGQARGALRFIQNGRRVFKGEEAIEFTSIDRFHLMVVVPELDLLAEATHFGGKLLREVRAATDAYLQIVDPSELARLRSYARAASASSGISFTGALEHVLLGRWERACELPSPFVVSTPPEHAGS